uniref:Uncharacterized protein n=1 Tax=Brassica oleracea TaxID=3712 RepID=A0A3P6FTU6_BRAOL|nr:unnamed protein product [Brassica oleracea]
MCDRRQRQTHSSLRMLVEWPFHLLHLQVTAQHPQDKVLLPPVIARLLPTTVPLPPSTVPLPPTTGPPTVPLRPPTVPLRQSTGPPTIPLRPHTVPLRPTTVPPRPHTVPLRPTTVPVLLALAQQVLPILPLPLAIIVGHPELTALLPLHTAPPLHLTSLLHHLTAQHRLLTAPLRLLTVPLHPHTALHLLATAQLHQATVQPHLVTGLRLQATILSLLNIVHLWLTLLAMQDYHQLALATPYITIVLAHFSIVFTFKSNTLSQQVRILIHFNLFPYSSGASPDYSPSAGYSPTLPGYSSSSTGQYTPHEGYENDKTGEDASKDAGHVEKKRKKERFKSISTVDIFVTLFSPSNNKPSPYSLGLSVYC